MLGGIAAVVVLVAVTLFVLLFARSGALHGSRFRLFVAAPEANNLIKGSDVWLNGQRVGLVRNIAFDKPTAPPEVRVIIEIEVLSEVRKLIHLDSRASLRSGGTVIGAPVVYINSGSGAAREVVPDDTLRAAGNPDLEIAASRVTESAEQLPVLLADSREIVANATTTAHRMSVILGAAPKSASLSKNASTLMGKLSSGRGSAGRIMHDTVLRARVARSMAAMDSLRQLLATRMADVGRFRRDSTLARAVRDLQGEVSLLRTMTASTDGAIGRMRADSSLRHGLDSALLELSALFADIKKHPTKYSRVF